MAVIELKGLTKYYGKSRGIVDIDLTVNEGEIFGFIGPNGAGKSTTIRTLLNFIFPSKGSAKILGMDCVKDSPRIKEQVGYVPSEVKLYGEMKVKDLLKYGASFHKGVDKEYMDMLCQRFEVEMGKRIGDLSLGNRKKVSIVNALMHSPKLLILDEVTSGLDPLMQNRLFETLVEVNKKGTTIFLSSHNLNEVQKFCNRVAIIRDGRIIEVKSVDKLLANNARRVTVVLKESMDNALEKLNGQNVTKDKNKVSFLYNGSMDTLVKTLSTFIIDDLKIEEPSLEETFMNYYEKGGNER